MTREEFQERCKVRRLKTEDTICAFDCNDEDLNDFLLNEANLYLNALLSVTYIVEDKITSEVRLAIARTAQHQSIGTYLLEFIEEYFLIDNKSGCRFVTVDAYVDAIPFYIKNNYQFLNNDDEDKRTRVMYFDLASLI